MYFHKIGHHFHSQCINNQYYLFELNYSLIIGILTDLFDYKGKFKIISVKAVDTNAEFLPITIEAQTDYTELSSTNPEDSTISIEDLDSTYTVGERIGRTLLLLSKKDNQTMANNFLNNNNKILSGSVTASMQETSQTASISTGTSY